MTGAGVIRVRCVYVVASSSTRGELSAATAGVACTADRAIVGAVVGAVVVAIAAVAAVAAARGSFASPQPVSSAAATIANVKVLIRFASVGSRVQIFCAITHTC